MTPETIAYNTLIAQGSLLTLKFAHPGLYAGRKAPRRGKVTIYSRKSRIRLLKRFCELEIAQAKPVFITMTYPDEYPDPQTARRHLDNFLKRLRRRFPGAPVSGIWRLEWQQRGAPHFHLLLFHLPFWHKSEVQAAWNEVIHADGSTFTRIEAIKSWRQGMYYVAKYMGKVSDGAHSGFIHRPYLTDTLIVHPQTGAILDRIGRYWGVFQRADLPYAEKIEINIFSFDPDYGFKLRDALAYQFKRLDTADATGGFVISRCASLVVYIAAWLLSESANRAPPVSFSVTPARFAVTQLDTYPKTG